MKTLTLSFRIFVEDDFIEKVKEYEEYDSADQVEECDVIEYVNNHIIPAQSKVNCFAVEGGDTDGWFIDSLTNYDAKKGTWFHDE